MEPHNLNPSLGVYPKAGTSLAASTEGSVNASSQNDSVVVQCSVTVWA